MVAVGLGARSRGCPAPADAAASREREDDEGLAPQRLVTAADVALDKGGTVGRGRLRGDLDGATERFGVHAGDIRLGDRDRADQPDRNRVERHRAIAPEGGCVVGGRESQSAERRAVQVRIQPADIDVAALTLIGLEGNAGDASHGFRGRDVGEFPDLAIGLDVDEVRRFLLRLAGHVRGGALRLDQDLLQRAAGWGCAAAIGCRGGAGIGGVGCRKG